MKSLKRIFAVMLALVMIMSFAACGKKASNVAEDGYYYLSNELAKKDFPAVDDPLDPEKIYSSLEYDERMLYGYYLFNNAEKDKKKFLETANFEELEYGFVFGYDSREYKEELTTLPCDFRAGHSAVDRMTADRNNHWAELTFLTKEGEERAVLGVYTVSGKTLSFTPVSFYEETHDDKGKLTAVKYVLSEKSLEYTFSIKGPQLTLTRNDESVSLCSYYFTDNAKKLVELDGYLSVGSPMIENFDCMYFKLYDDGSCFIYFNDSNSDLIYTPVNAAKIGEDGLLTVYWQENDEEKTEHVRQFVYIGGYNGLILADNDNVYYYSDSYTSRQQAALSEGLTIEEATAIGQLTESELKEIAEKKANMLTDLEEEFKKQGIKATINKTTGEVALDSAVLFGVDQSDVSAEGKAFLTKFLKAYVGIVFSDKYEDFVSKVVVEGHTDTDGDYEHNKKLSQARADSVKAFCASAESGLDAASQALLTPTLEATGYSYDRPVYDANGKVDMDASRRVSFRFTVNIGK